MREQPMRVRTGALRAITPVCAVILLTAALGVAAIFLFLYERPYSPPPYEPEAITGVPEPPENFRYSKIDVMGSFIFGIAGTTYQQEDGSLKIFFANPEENEAYLLCEVISADGVALYKSGLLRPGEYVERLRPLIGLKNEAIRIEIYIYALEPDTFYSVGMVTLDNILQPN
jgi:hypothetical protein